MACATPGSVAHSGLKTARAWRRKETLRDPYAARFSAEDAGPLLERWISWARRCRLPALKRLAAILRARRDGIIEHFRIGLSNGFIEVMNAQIQTAKARAKSHATTDNLIAIA